MNELTRFKWVWGGSRRFRLVGGMHRLHTTYFCRAWSSLCCMKELTRPSTAL